MYLSSQSPYTSGTCVRRRGRGPAAGAVAHLSGRGTTLLSSTTASPGRSRPTCQSSRCTRTRATPWSAVASAGSAYDPLGVSTCGSYGSSGGDRTMAPCTSRDARLVRRLTGGIDARPSSRGARPSAGRRRGRRRRAPARAGSVPPRRVCGRRRVPAPARRAARLPLPIPRPGGIYNYPLQADPTSLAPFSIDCPEVGHQIFEGLVQYDTQAGRDGRHRPVPRRELVGERRRHGVDLQAAPRRAFPGSRRQRDDGRRRGGRLPLRRRPPDRGRRRLHVPVSQGDGRRRPGAQTRAGPLRRRGAGPVHGALHAQAALRHLPRHPRRLVRLGLSRGLRAQGGPRALRPSGRWARGRSPCRAGCAAATSIWPATRPGGTPRRASRISTASICRRSAASAPSCWPSRRG